MLLQAASGKKDVPWGHIITKSIYSAIGGRDVLILAPDLSLPHPEAVARRPGQLTVADRLKLLCQGVPLDCQSELTIIRARREMCKRNKIVEVKSGQSLSRDEVMKSIAHLLNTTQNNGGREGTSTLKKQGRLPANIKDIIMVHYSHLLLASWYIIHVYLP